MFAVGLIGLLAAAITPETGLLPFPLQIACFVVGVPLIGAGILMPLGWYYAIAGGVVGFVAEVAIACYLISSFHGS